MEPGGSLPCSQEASARLCHEKDESWVFRVVPSLPFTLKMEVAGSFTTLVNLTTLPAARWQDD
jgi:hypothetical protein